MFIDLLIISIGSIIKIFIFVFLVYSKSIETLKIFNFKFITHKEALKL